jgi:hypothetical protein
MNEVNLNENSPRCLPDAMRFPPTLRSCVRYDATVLRYSCVSSKVKQTVSYADICINPIVPTFALCRVDHCDHSRHPIPRTQFIPRELRFDPVGISSSAAS